MQTNGVSHTARFGPFLIVQKIGEGAMAKVYLARHTDPSYPHREVALKVLRREYSQQQDVLQLLKREALIGQKMRHPNVVGTLEFGEFDGMPYLAMEYVQGVTVQNLLELVEDDGVGLPPELAACLLVQVCEGLSYAHSLRDTTGKNLGVVHRDLKPGNVIVSLAGVAKVMDFGVAKIKRYGGTMTSARTTRGTPAYMSPEQASGMPLTHKSDIFATGLMVYELVTGYKPFIADNLNDLLRKIQDADVTGLAEELDAHTPGLGRIFKRCIDLDPVRRYPDARWMKDDLESLFPPDTIIPPPTRGDGDQTQYYEIDDGDQTSPAEVLTEAPMPAPRMLSADMENDIDEPELSVEESVEQSLEQEMESLDEAVLESIPDLDLDDESVPEVDLGAPVFLEMNPRPDPRVPGATDTLSHLTQFLVEVEN